MSDVANLDEAEKCLEIAKAALQVGNLDKATRFAEKAMKLHPHDEARKLLRIIKSRQGGTSSASGASPVPNGTGSTATSRDMRQRATTGSAAKAETKEDRSTPDQRELVASILRKRDFYQILGLERSCSEDDIKRAYKKLALKLHPDKNTATRSDEAFKAVSKAFSCLSDANKRAAYDRYGEDQPGISRAGRGSPFGGPQGFDDFDPNEIFNMFFGGFPGGRNAHVFRTQFGGFAGQRQPQGEAPSFPVQLLHLLPIIAMLAFTFFAFQPSQPVYSLDRAADFQQQITSQRFQVPYFVKPGSEFERSHPRGSRDRSRVEQEAESAYKERLDRLCYNERLSQQRMYRWGQAAKAKEQPLLACKEIVDRFGNQYAFHTPIYGF